MTRDFTDPLRRARAALDEALHLLRDEIRDYPTPIAGCDAQFNHLLAERTRVTDALARLDAPVFVPTPRTLTPDARVESR